MEEYLPPVVTKLKGDISDLVMAFAEARTAGRGFARGIREDLQAEMGDVGRASGGSFSIEMERETRKGLGNLADDIVPEFAGETAEAMGEIGRNSASSFASAFQGLLIPALIAILVLMMPVIGTAIAGAISLGIGAGFIGLAAFLLREQEGLIKAAQEFKTTLKAVFTDAAMPMLQPLIGALGILKQMVIDIGPSLKEIFAALADSGGIQALATGLAGMFKEMMPGLKELAPVIGSLLSALGSALPGIGRGLSDMFSSLAEAGPGMILFIENFGQQLEVIFRGLGQFMQAMSETYAWLDKWHKISVAGGWDTPFHAVVTGAKIAWEWIVRAAKAVGSWFSDLGSDIADWAKDTWKDITGWVDRVGQWFGALPGRIGDFLSSLPGVLSSAAGRAFDLFFFMVGYGIGRAIKIVTEFPAAVMMALVNLKNFMIEWAVSTFISVGAKWEEFKARVPVILAETWAAIKQWAADVYHGTVTWAENTINAIGDWFDKLPERARAMGDGLIAWAKKLFHDIGVWGYEAGKNLIEGLVKGTGELIDWAVDRVKRAVEKIKDGIKSALGIHSPSTVFAELGKFSMQGFVQGFLKEQAGTGPMWDGLFPGGPGAPAMAMAVSGSGAGYGGGGSGTTMVHTTIKIDGQAFVEAVTPAAQQRKDRYGATGLA